jgi:ATP-dependent Zn protease
MKNIKQTRPKGILFWIASLIIIIVLWNMLSNVTESGAEKIEFSEFMQRVRNGQIDSAKIKGNVVTGDLKSSNMTEMVR